MPPAAHLERRCEDGPGQDAQQGTSRLPRWPGRSGPSVPSAGRIGCAQVPWQVLGWFLTVQDEAGALHVVSWLMQNFKMEDVGFMAAVPEGRGGGAGGAGLDGAVLDGGLDFSGRAQQAVNWQDEIFSLASGPEGVTGALVGFDDPTGH